MLNIIATADPRRVSYEGFRARAMSPLRQSMNTHGLGGRGKRGAFRPTEFRVMLILILFFFSCFFFSFWSQSGFFSYVGHILTCSSRYVQHGASRKARKHACSYAAHGCLRESLSHTPCLIPRAHATAPLAAALSYEKLRCCPIEYADISSSDINPSKFVSLCAFLREMYERLSTHGRFSWFFYGQETN